MWSEALESFTYVGCIRINFKIEFSSIMNEIVIDIKYLFQIEIQSDIKEGTSVHGVQVLRVQSLTWTVMDKL